MNWPERKLWAELRKLGGHLRRQAPIGRYVVDFVSHRAKLVIEVDGGVHERLATVVLRDAERTRWLESQGYMVLRFNSRDVEADVHAIVEQVKPHLALPLDGGGLGGGAGAAAQEGALRALAPVGDFAAEAVRSPPSPALPPSRGKGV